MEESRIFVFKEIYYLNQIMFQWFRVGSEDEEHIVPDMILTEHEHWQRVNAD